jgi:hypothetical protein
LEEVATVGLGVVCHHLADTDPVAREERQGSMEECGAGLSILGLEDLRIGETGSIVDADVDELPAYAPSSRTPISRDAVPDSTDLAEFLDVDVE